MVDQRAYFGTSVVVPLYREESITAQAEDLQSEWKPVISMFTEVEVASTLARLVRSGALEEDQVREMESVFAEDLRAGVFERIEVSSAHCWRGRNWLQERTAALRTLDALHLACAVEGSLLLVTADETLFEAAEKLGRRAKLLQ